ncbi:MAG: hypothetical protein BWY42_01563 [Candidatus Omnitrophica bacterium ADurb.Bin277]|nr:MAG: hypothetical protein BWY42_01563 [Candidatus Omnitrophica bacterium ADurb.Bin277]
MFHGNVLVLELFRFFFRLHECGIQPRGHINFPGLGPQAADAGNPV